MLDSKSDTSDSKARVGSFLDDRRAIEGLPVRLVIALVVGVASLSVMMGMIGDIDGLSSTEVDAQPQPEVTTPGSQTLDVAVVDPDGNRVSDATVIVRGGSARLDGLATAKSGPDGIASVDVSPKLGANQLDGTLSIDVKPPAGSDFVDERGNTEVLVVAE
ncbi:DUF7382 domain-containing protein [Halorubrum cibi]|uniref:DUF7382 domain-containing protein n=1 Tax=Halorubrum cibi TaxID=413815 RepID=A0A521AXT9_9EURY|nr:carboxypeptidase regulatory-like domain-containing protein [Halorubrum cibi]SMO39647.1 hypothetical protein SAMN06264867_101451 [Halorubrum cibi]